MDDQELQRKYMEFQAIDEQIQKIQKQIQTFDEHLIEIENVKASLDDLNKVEKGTEILAPVSQGIFVKAKLEDNTNLVVNVGAGATIEAPVSRTKDLLDRQVEEISKARDVVLRTLEEVSQQARKMEEDIAKQMKAK